MAGDGSDYDWAGALMVADALDDMKYLRGFAQGYANGLKKQARRRR